MGLNYKEIPILEVANILGIEQRSPNGATIECICPFHDDHNPSLMLNTKDNFFKCFGCGAGGNVPELVKLALNFEFNEAVKWLAEQFPQFVVKEGFDSRPLKQKVYIIRSIFPNANKRYRVITNPEHLELRNPDVDDPTAIREILNKKVSLTTLNATNTKIARLKHNDNEIATEFSYSLAFEVDDHLATIHNRNNLSVQLHTEGMTDYISAVELGLQNHFCIVGDQSKLNRYLEPGIKHILILDDGTDIDELKKTISKKIHTTTIVKFVPLPNNVKDLSDYFVLNECKVEDILNLIKSFRYHVIDPETPEKAEIDPFKLTEKQQEQLKDEVEGSIYSEINGKPRLLQSVLAKYISIKYPIVSTEDSSKKIRFYYFRNGFWEPLDRTEVNFLITIHLKYSHAYSQINSIRGLLEHEHYIKQHLFDSRDDLINLNNCAFDLINFEPVLHSREHYFTFKNEYNYNPRASCEVYDKAVEDYSKNPKKNDQVDNDWILAHWEILGYCLTGRYNFQKMFWFFGKKGGNGKGTILRVFEALVGLKLTKANFDLKHLDGNFYRKDLINKRLALTGDLPPILHNIPKLKELTGGDRQSTDVKFGDSIDFTNKAKFIFSMNKVPSFGNEAIEPILRRIHILPFDNQINEMKSEIEDQFKMELSGIFNRAIEGLERLERNKQFTICIRGEHILNMIRNDNDILQVFIDEKIEESPNNKVPHWKIWETYTKFMNYNIPNWLHRQGYIKTQRSLIRELRNKLGIISEVLEYSKKDDGKEGDYAHIIGYKIFDDTYNRDPFTCR